MIKDNFEIIKSFVLYRYSCLPNKISLHLGRMRISNFILTQSQHFLSLSASFVLSVIFLHVYIVLHKVLKLQPP